MRTPATWRWSSGGLALEALGKAVEPLEVPKVPPEAYGDLLGLYGEPTEGILARLEWRDGTLRLHDPSEPDGDLVLAADR